MADLKKFETDPSDAGIPLNVLDRFSDMQISEIIFVGTAGMTGLFAGRSISM